MLIRKSFLESFPRFATNHRRAFLVAYAFAGAGLLLGMLAASRARVPREGASPMAFVLSSSSFSNGGNIAKRFTCDGADVSPELAWTEPPPGTRTFALLVDDPDAPVGNWNHWTMWNLPPGARGLPEGIGKAASLDDGSEQGLNDFGKTGYNGPCPPPGKAHRYYFKVFALDEKLHLTAGAGKHELEAAMKGHIFGQAEWMGRYGR